MRDYRGIDSNEPTPDIVELWDGIEGSKVHVRALDPRLDRLTRLFHEDRTSAALMVAQFDLDLPQPVRFYLSRNRLYETGWFYWFFHRPVVREALPGLGEVLWSPDSPPESYPAQRIGARLGLDLIDGWTAMAELAGRVRQNGVYMFEPRPTDRETARVVLAFARAAFRAEPSEAVCHLSRQGWCEWFRRESEDGTLFCIDLATGVGTVVMITDGP
jgi:hypothetical protein